MKKYNKNSHFKKNGVGFNFCVRRSFNINLSISTTNLKLEGQKQQKHSELRPCWNNASINITLHAIPNYALSLYFIYNTFTLRCLHQNCTIAHRGDIQRQKCGKFATSPFLTY